MIGMMLSIVLAAIWWLLPSQQGLSVDCRWIVAYSGLLFLSLSLIVLAILWSSLSRIQNKTMTALGMLFVQDSYIVTVLSALFAFCLFSYAILACGITQLLFGCWIVAFGAAFDLLRRLFFHVARYADVSFLLERMAKQVTKYLKHKDETAALNAIVVVVETCNLAIHKGQITVAGSCIDSIQKLTEVYIQEMAQSELLNALHLAEEAPSFLDKVNVLCLVTCERLLWIYERSLAEHAEPVAEVIIAVFGKMSLTFSRYNERPALLPLAFVSKCAVISQAKGREEFVIRSALALSETCKAFIRLSHEKKQSCKEQIFACIVNMEEVIKMLFRANKSINPVLLMQPFAEVAQFIGADAMQSVLDREEILGELKRVLTQFQSLQVVVPAVADMMDMAAKDTSSTFAQDSPF